MRPSGISNPTYATHDHLNHRYIVGDYNTYDFAVYDDKIVASLGRISTVEDTFPFYTNASTNPLTSTNLSEGESEIITFWVNATGYVLNVTEFFAYANTTSNLSISNMSDKWNVTITIPPYEDDGTLEQDVNYCGELNTSNAVYTLFNNVSSTGNCFNITAENITLDCNGYEIEYAFYGESGYGLYTNQNNITVKNCIITEGSSATDSKYAIYLDGSNNSLIGNNNITTSGQYSYGIYVKQNLNNLINGNTVRTSGRYTNCIDVSWGSKNTLTGNNVSGSYDAYGISIFQSNGNNITGNIANNNDYSGIGLYDGSSNNTVENNTANYNTDHGIYVYKGDDNNITNNNCTSNNQHGIYINDNANRNILKNNNANMNGNYGIHIRWYSFNNNLTGNTANNNTLGIYMYYLADNNIITNSTINDNNEYGIYLRRADNNLLANLTVKSNTFYDVFVHPEGDARRLLSALRR
jgi:parallel beta-helix repeat protein